MLDQDLCETAADPQPVATDADIPEEEPAEEESSSDEEAAE